MSSNHLVLCHRLHLLPSIFPSISVFSNKSQVFISGGQSIGASASASVLAMTIQDWFSLGLTCLISLQSKGLSRVFSDTREPNSLGLYNQPLNQPRAKTVPNSRPVLAILFHLGGENSWQALVKSTVTGSLEDRVLLTELENASSFLIFYYIIIKGLFTRSLFCLVQQVWLSTKHCKACKRQKTQFEETKQY